MGYDTPLWEKEPPFFGKFPEESLPRNKSCINPICITNSHRKKNPKLIPFTKITADFFL